MYEGTLKNSNIRVEKRKRAIEALVCFEGDIRQVLNNVVGNAIDAMPGGGRLFVRSRKGTDWRSGREGWS
jgi:signal transduction histidine kinase